MNVFVVMVQNRAGANPFALSAHTSAEQARERARAAKEVEGAYDAWTESLSLIGADGRPVIGADFAADHPS